MIKINNVPIINPITTFTHNQKEKISFVCDSGLTVLWELLRIPISCNDPSTLIEFESGGQSSSSFTEYLVLELSGTYKIQLHIHQRAVLL